MRVGVVASDILIRRERSENISGHALVAYETANRLTQAGDEVVFIGTANDRSDLVPPSVYSGDYPIQLVDDARRRGDATRQEGSSFSVRGAARQFLALRRLFADLSLDILHWFGFQAGALGARALRLWGVRPLVYTHYAPQTSLAPRLLPSADADIAATEFVAESVSGGRRVVVLRHGLREPRRHEGESRSRVLFWREGTHANGADLVASTFAELAPRHPEITFTAALRFHREELDVLDHVATAHANVEILRYPYADGLTIDRILAQSLIAVLPFRVLTIHPQMAMAESLAAGVPVAALPVGSVPELIVDGVNGVLGSSGDELSARLGELLATPDLLHAMGAEARRLADEVWDWSRYVNDLRALYRQVLTARNS